MAEPKHGIEGFRSTGAAGDALEYAARLREIEAEIEAHKQTELASGMAAPVLIEDEAKHVNREHPALGLFTRRSKMNGNLKPVPLPVTRDELLARKTMKSGPSLNDDMDRIHTALWDDPIYRRFLEAVFDSDAVEGSLTADNYEAAQMIRDFAGVEERNEFHYIAKKNKTTIVKSLNVILRRYHMSRQERAATVQGEPVGIANSSE